MDRRQFLKLAGFGSVVLVTGVKGGALGAETKAGADHFTFVQLSDTHWGFTNPVINPDFAGTLKKAISHVNGLDPQPDFVVFTGDLTETTDDDKERRKRLTEFRAIAGDLKVKDVKFLPGEHDASLDNGKAYHDLLGKSYYTFDHKGVHFIVVDNVSDAAGKIGDPQLDWLNTELKKLKKDSRIVVLTHRPLFDLAADWDWATPDAAKAIDLLMPFTNVTVLYGHIHQEHHHTTGHISHHAAKSLIWPLPAPHSVPKKVRIPWDPATPYKGLGIRSVKADVQTAKYELTELPVQKG